MEYSNVEITYLSGVVATYSLTIPTNTDGETLAKTLLNTEWGVFNTTMGTVVVRLSEIRSILFFNGDLWKR